MNSELACDNWVLNHLVSCSIAPIWGLVWRGEGGQLALLRDGWLYIPDFINLLLSFSAISTSDDILECIQSLSKA